MTTHQGNARPSRNDWTAGLALGAAIGAVVLGIGGRISMWGVAVLAGGTTSFSIGGSLLVVLMGAVSGLGGAIVFLSLRRLLPRWRAGRGLLFWAFLVWITLRGLNPVDAERLLLFMPLIVVYGAGLQILWCRVYWPRRRALSPSVATAA